MTTYYLDPEGGNDANDATTFANRKKTMSALTSGILAPGDVVRIIASPDVTTPGNATWTDNDGTVTWAANKNAVIENCESGWTGVANITLTHPTTRFKEGSACVNMSPAGAFTTGKMGYKNLGGALDLSAFQGVSLWLYSGSTFAAGVFELKLCSDTAGDTPVHTIPLEATNNTSLWSVHTWDNGSALNSGINSVALYAVSDPGTANMSLDNIVACKATSSSDYVSHKHCIGKNTGGEPEWYAILSIAADSVEIGGSYAVNLGSSSQVLPRPYRGTTETVATYLVRGIDPPGTSTTIRTVQDSGTEGSPITFSGGWDRTAMSSQTGVTYFQGRHHWGQAIYGLKSWLEFEKIGGLNFTAAVFQSAGAATNLRFDVEQAVGCTSGFIATDSSDGGFLAFKFKSIQGAAGNGVVFGQATTTASIGYTAISVQGDRVHGTTGATSAAAVTGCSYNNLFITKIDNNAGIGLSHADVALGVCKCYGTTFTNNTSDITLAASRNDLLLYDCTYSTVTVSAALYNMCVRSTRKGGDANVHEIVNRFYTVATEASVRHTASGVAWKINPLSTSGCVPDAPAYVPLAKIACEGSALVTFKCWVRRTNTGLSVGVRVVPSDIVGDPMTVTETLMTAAIDTWEEITLTFTLSAKGVVEVLGVAWGGTTYTAYFDDLTITQA